MAYFQIKSNNDNLSYILYKNPNSGMVLRKYRVGVFFGWYSNENTYNMYFKDGDDEKSFKSSSHDEFEYNDTTRYNSPIAVMGSINEFFQHLLKEGSDERDVLGCENIFMINMLYIKQKKYVDLLKKYYKDFDIQITEVSNHNYSVVIKTNKSIKDLINFVYLFALFYSCLESYVYVHDSDIEKYIKVINYLDSPYFIRYIVKYRIIKSEKMFNDFKEKLEYSNNQNIKLSYGDTGQQRKTFVLNEINADYPLLDVGCSDMKGYGVTLAKKLSNLNHYYHGIDISEDAIKLAEKRIRNENIDNALLYNSIDEFLENYSTTTIMNITMVEVFEHNNINDSQILIEKLLKSVKFNSFIITSPNKDFNKYYLLDDNEVRLEDHKFEMTENELKDYFNTLLGNFKFKYEFKNIGDYVDGHYPTMGVVINGQ